MFKLDNEFLDSLGLGNLPMVEKNALLAHIYETLQTRVGMKLAEKMSEQQMDEFEGFIDPNPARAITWLDAHRTGWRQDTAFTTLLETELRNGGSQESVISQHAAKMWLEVNFPNYKDVVAGELAALRQEIAETAPQILNAAGVVNSSTDPARTTTLEPNASAVQAGVQQQPGIDTNYPTNLAA
jgi:hypothetical protein